MSNSNPRPCPICNSFEHTLFMEERIDKNKITEFSYASRKTPEYMTHKLVICSNCKLVYAPIIPQADTLGHLYLDASYDSTEEANFAAQSYANALKPFINKIPKRLLAVDVGAGNGALLSHFLDFGFKSVIGIEPSVSAINAAHNDIKPYLKAETFSVNSFENTADLICSFMTLEHILDPKEFLHIAYDKLSTNGMVAIVVHDYEALLNRVLGKYSPIIDIEHLQLFCKNAVRELLKNTGFSDVHVSTIKNTYNIAYWLRLAPLPNKIKEGINKHKSNFLLSSKLSLDVGNIIAFGIKK